MKISVTATSFSKNTELREKAIAAFSTHQLKFCDPDKSLSGDTLAEFIGDSDIVILGKETINDEILRKLPVLKGISKYGVGLDNLDFDALKSHGIQWFHTPGVNRDSVAELAVGLMISVLRKIAISDRHIHAGKWVKDGGIGLTGKTVAIVGCGHCGGALAKLLRGFSCKLILVDILDVSPLAKETGGIILPFEKAIAEADVISLHVPLTNLTNKMLSFQDFKSMKETAVVINTCRGEVIEEKALIEALKCRSIRGAGLDVFEIEPVGNKRLYSLDNLVATAHIAGNSKEAVLAMGEASIKGVQEFLLNNC